jgi:hypothetical protein
MDSKKIETTKQDPSIASILTAYKHAVVEVAEKYAIILHEHTKVDPVHLLTHVTIDLGTDMLLSAKFTDACENMSDEEFATCLPKFTALSTEQKEYLTLLLADGDKNVNEALDIVGAAPN